MSGRFLNSIHEAYIFTTRTDTLKCYDICTSYARICRSEAERFTVFVRTVTFLNIEIFMGCLPAYTNVTS